MVEHSGRQRVDDQPRRGADDEWEVFLRGEEAEPLRHVGSVSAPSADIAHEEATSLFGWHATDLWLCPAGEVRRYTTRSLAERAESASTEPEDGTRLTGR